jgi:hypothetical protein
MTYTKLELILMLTRDLSWYNSPSRALYLKGTDPLSPALNGKRIIRGEAGACHVANEAYF